MDQGEMVALIRAGVPPAGGVWADLGAGTGNFTLALAEILGPTATIYALARDDRGSGIGLRRAAPLPRSSRARQMSPVHCPCRPSMESC